jgi:stage V sporulation protein G
MPRTIPPELQTRVATLEVTSVQVYRLKEPLGKTRALARVVLADQMQLTGLRVVDGANGLFVSYPNDPSYKGDDYRSLFYPVTRELREHIESAVLARYNDGDDGSFNNN